MLFLILFHAHTRLHTLFDFYSDRRSREHIYLKGRKFASDYCCFCIVCVSVPELLAFCSDKKRERLLPLLNFVTHKIQVKFYHFIFFFSRFVRFKHMQSKRHTTQATFLWELHWNEELNKIKTTHTHKERNIGILCPPQKMGHFQDMLNDLNCSIRQNGER